MVQLTLTINFIYIFLQNFYCCTSIYNDYQFYPESYIIAVQLLPCNLELLLSHLSTDVDMI